MEKQNNIFVLENLKYLCSAKSGSIWFDHDKINTLFQMLDDKMHIIKKEHPYLRNGQILFNLVFHTFKEQLKSDAPGIQPDIPNCVQHPKVEADCFSVDTRIPMFLRTLRCELFKNSYELREFERTPFIDESIPKGVSI